MTAVVARSYAKTCGWEEGDAVKGRDVDIVSSIVCGEVILCVGHTTLNCDGATVAAGSNNSAAEVDGTLGRDSIVFTVSDDVAAGDSDVTGGIDAVIARGGAVFASGDDVAASDSDVAGGVDAVFASGGDGDFTTVDCYVIISGCDTIPICGDGENTAINGDFSIFS